MVLCSACECGPGPSVLPTADAQQLAMVVLLRLRRLSCLPRDDAAATCISISVGVSVSDDSDGAVVPVVPVVLETRRGVTTAAAFGRKWMLCTRYVRAK